MMTSTQTIEQNVYSKLTGKLVEHQDELTTTENSNLNNSSDNLSPKELKSDLEFSKKIEHFTRKLSAPNPQFLSLTLNQINAENRLRCSYIDRLLFKGLLNKC